MMIFTFVFLLFPFAVSAESRFKTCGILSNLGYIEPETQTVHPGDRIELTCRPNLDDNTIGDLFRHGNLTTYFIKRKGHGPYSLVPTTFQQGPSYARKLIYTNATFADQGLYACKVKSFYPSDLPSLFVCVSEVKVRAVRPPKPKVIKSNNLIPVTDFGCFWEPPNFNCRFTRPQLIYSYQLSFYDMDYDRLGWCANDVSPFSFKVDCQTQGSSIGIEDHDQIFVRLRGHLTIHEEKTTTNFERIQNFIFVLQTNKTLEQK